MNSDIYVRDWMAACPFLQAEEVAKMGKLEYGIYPSPQTTRYRENVLGELIPEEIQVADFIFTSKRIFGNGSVSYYDFYTGIFQWIEQQNRIGNFPRLNEGIATSVSPTLTQYVSEPARGEERSQIQIRVTYRKHYY